MPGKNIIGGQAVIEGVLMKNENKIAIAVRKPNGKIKIKKELLREPSVQLLKWPFIRGFRILVETLIIGLKALTYSANEAEGKEENKMSKKEISLIMFISTFLAVGVFLIIPFFLTKWITKEYNLTFNLIDGIIRIILFVSYVLIISTMGDVKRLFQYHGAEHMVVNCYEKGEPLTVRNVKKCPTFHKRCGTSFIMIVLIIAIITFSLITPKTWAMRLLSRIILIPLIAGISYEILRITPKIKNNLLSTIITWPGKMIQKITTARPDNKMIEVAIKALISVI
ncbi:DUF1385 domain-containing protein [Candidatus Woesearchaeota archaeon]|nr:MAG: DUF1385 domain-containing protein [Candidatus Woesearchaeota archaeon]